MSKSIVEFKEKEEKKRREDWGNNCRRAKTQHVQVLRQLTPLIKSYYKRMMRQ